MENKISDIYIKKIGRYFLWNHFIESLGLIIFILSLWHDFFTIDWFAENWSSFRVFGILIIIPFTIMFIVQLNVRKRLISEYVVSNDSTTLKIYDGTVEHVSDFQQILEHKQSSDWLLGQFLSSRNGIGLIYKQGILDGYVLYVGEKKYYVVPKLFEFAVATHS